MEVHLMSSVLFPMRSMISAWFSSNQSLCLLVENPKYSIAVLYTITQKVIPTASTSCLSIRMVSRCSSKALRNDCLVGTSFSSVMISHFSAFLPCGLVLGWTLMLSLEMIRQWSIQHSAPHMALVTLISRLSLISQWHSPSDASA